MNAKFFLKSNLVFLKTQIWLIIDLKPGQNFDQKIDVKFLLKAMKKLTKI
jgi:hypothetical protein